MVRNDKHIYIQNTRKDTPDKNATSSKSGSFISTRSRRQTLLPLWPPPTIDTLKGPAL